MCYSRWAITGRLYPTGYNRQVITTVCYKWCVIVGAFWAVNYKRSGYSQCAI